MSRLDELERLSRDDTYQDVAREDLIEAVEIARSLEAELQEALDRKADQ